MRKFITCSILLSAVLALYGQDNGLDQTIRNLTSDPVFSHAGVGICVMKGDGEILAEHNAEKMFLPASNMKLVSTGAALSALGPAYRFSTEIGHDGYMEDGILHGNLYIIGGADPMTGSKDSIATDLNTTFMQWKKAVQAAGIKEIRGHVIGDGRWLDGMSEEPTWLWNDIGTYYGSGVTGLMFYENMMSFSVAPGKSVGDPVDIEPFYPSCSWMSYRYDCTTGEKGTGDKLYMYTHDLAPVGEIRGTFGVDRGRKRVDCSNKYPEYTCAVYFKNFLEKNGIRCSAGAADFKLKKEWLGAGRPTEERLDQKGDSLKIIGIFHSPALERIVFKINHESNNLLAETLLRTLGKEMRGSSCYDSSYLALDDVLRRMHLNPSKGLKVQDGSGLSRQNLTSADFFCRFLGAMTDSPCFEEFLRSLPVPGENGSLSYNMKGYPESLRSRIRVKSGSMNGVRCYSGYILPAGFTLVPGKEIPQEIKDEIIIFSILTNNCISPAWQVRPMLDRLMGEIADPAILQ